MSPPPSGHAAAEPTAESANDLPLSSPTAPPPQPDAPMAAPLQLPGTPSRTVRLIHFNDVYNINAAPSEPVGGAARFVTAVRAAAAASPYPTLVLFSGDAFSPAPLTPHTAGAELPPVLNAAGVDVACMGNHDVDRGEAVLRARVAETRCPWLLSNLDDARTAAPLGGLRRSHVVRCGGLTFGFCGLAGPDWVPTLDKVDPEALVYTDYCASADALSARLRAEHDCDIVVALTHMREPDDERLAREAKDVDIVLGGHDHIYSTTMVNGRWVIKSGTDFKNFSTTDITVDEHGRVSVAKPVRHDVTSAVPPDPAMDKFVAEQLKLLGPGYFEKLAVTSTALDGRFVSIRTRETGLGNFVCDAMASAMGVSIGLINAGSFRSDSVEPRGLVTRRTVDTVLPFQDEVLEAAYTGADLLSVLNNGVSQYPLLDGRFLQVSGLRFAFDPRADPLSRIVTDSVLVRAVPDGPFEPLELDAVYRVAVKSFVFLGKDGFPAADPAQIRARAEPSLPDMLVAHIRALGHGNDDTAGDGGTEEEEKEDGDKDYGKKLPEIGPQTDGRIECLHEDELLLQRYAQV